MERIAAKTKKGFSLLEILIVVVIMGILAAMALPGFNRTMTKAEEREARANLEKIYNAQRMYRMDRGAYYKETSATDLSGLETYIDNPNHRSETYVYGIESADSNTFRASAEYTGNTTLIIDQTGKITKVE